MADKQGTAPSPPDVPIAIADKADPPALDPAGMMAGVVPGAAKSDEKKPLLPVTHWGRYLKILLSSTEFIFIN